MLLLLPVLLMHLKPGYIVAHGTILEQEREQLNWCICVRIKYGAQLIRYLLLRVVDLNRKLLKQADA